MYTQCPACNTLFRISEQQLSAAKGKVRCGQCDHIYNAQGTLLDSLPVATSTPEPTPEPAPAEKTPAITREPDKTVTPIIDNDELLDIIAAENQPEHGNDKPNDIDLSAEDSVTNDSLDMPLTIPEDIVEDDWQIVNLGSSEPVDNSDDWFDDDHGLPDESADTNNNTSLKAPAGISDDDWQAVDLGSNESTDDDEDEDWFDNPDDEDDSPALTAPAGVNEDDWQAVDLGSNESTDDDEDEDWFDNPDDEDDSPALTVPAGVNEDDWQSVDLGSNEFTDDDEDWFEEVTEQHTGTEIVTGDDSDLMRNVSDYLDDDAADERFSDENAVNILDEVQQQLSFPIEDEPTNQQKLSTGIDLPGNWLDDMYKPSKASATSIPMSAAEELELDNAILKSIERPFTQVTKQHTDKPIFKAKESIVLESNEHLIGQHDKKPVPEKNEAIPLRIRDSLNVIPEVPRSALRWIAIITSITVLITALAAQVVMFRSTELANMYPQWQPLLLEACEKLPCRDASKQAIDQIQLMNRNISQHPKVKTALLIQAAILNRANFAQRYPNIQITLSDLTGSTVAQRVFTPKEYLGSLYHPFLQMKPGKPVHIALEVLDPGSTAINFEFKFL